MDLLLDTCAFIWWDSGGLSSTAEAATRNRENRLYLRWRIHYLVTPISEAGVSSEFWLQTILPRKNARALPPGPIGFEQDPSFVKPDRGVGYPLIGHQRAGVNPAARWLRAARPGGR